MQQVALFFNGDLSAKRTLETSSSTTSQRNAPLFIFTFICSRTLLLCQMTGGQMDQIGTSY